MGNKLIGWLGVSNSVSVANRVKDFYKRALIDNEQDLDLISMLTTAVPRYCSGFLECEPYIIGFIENINLRNEKLYELPHTRNMNPTGYGSGFRFSKSSLDDSFESVFIERYLLKNDDYLLLGDTYDQELTDVFYEENQHRINNFTGESLTKLAHKGVFDSKFSELINEERKGCLTFSSTPLMIYGYFTHNNHKCFIGTEQGYDLELFPETGLDIFSEYFNSSSGFDTRAEFFSLLGVLRMSRRSTYIHRDNMSQEHFLLCTLIKDNNYFQVIEYTKECGEDDEVSGVFLKLSPNSSGVGLEKVLKNSYFELKNLAPNLKRNKPMHFIESKIDANLTF